MPVTKDKFTRENYRRFVEWRVRYDDEEDEVTHSMLHMELLNDAGENAERIVIELDVGGQANVIKGVINSRLRQYETATGRERYIEPEEVLP